MGGAVDFWLEGYMYVVTRFYTAAVGGNVGLEAEIAPGNSIPDSLMFLYIRISISLLASLSLYLSVIPAAIPAASSLFLPRRRAHASHLYRRVYYAASSSIPCGS